MHAHTRVHMLHITHVQTLRFNICSYFHEMVMFVGDERAWLQGTAQDDGDYTGHEPRPRTSRGTAHKRTSHRIS